MSAQWESELLAAADRSRALQPTGQASVPPAADARPSASDPDWSRESCEKWWQPSRHLLQAVREYSRAKEAGGAVGWVRSKVAVARHRFWSVATGADIPLNTEKIGGGLLLPHPNGVVIHPDVEIGPNCLIFQQVTIGTGPRPGVPRIGGHVDIGAGAKILGGVVIGDHARIGANAVVISDVPAGAVATGIPAVVKHPADPDQFEGHFGDHFDGRLEDRRQDRFEDGDTLPQLTLPASLRVVAGGAALGARPGSRH
jgi:serine O-acetyltransferase